MEIKAKTAAVESTGQATAEAKARVQALLIKAKAAVDQARLKAQAAAIRNEAVLKQLKLKHAQEISHQRAVDELECAKAEREAKIEVCAFVQDRDHTTRKQPHTQKKEINPKITQLTG